MAIETARPAPRLLIVRLGIFWSLCTALAASASAAAAANASAYTPLDLDACRVIERIEEGESVRWLCPGHAAIPLYVSAGDGRFDIDAGIDNGQWETLAPFNYPGPRVEWRMRGRAAIAIVYRLIVDHPRPDARSVLMVESIGRGGRPGCLVAMVDGRTANANHVARRHADRADRFRCGRDAVVRIGTP